MKIFVPLFIALLFASVAFSQLQEVVEVDLVEVYVSSLDSEGLPVQDLTEKDFILKEDGVEQRIRYFTRLLDPESQIPLTIAFLVDTSGSMHKGTDKLRRIDIAKRFASLFLKEVKPTDNMQIVAFDNMYKPLTPMTSDLEKMKQALSEVQIDVQSNPSTALLAAVHVSIQRMDSYFGRKILIICSDGQNNAAGPSPEELIAELRKQDITVLSLATMKDLESQQTSSQAVQIDSAAGGLNIMNIQRERTPEAKKAKQLMKNLAEETGGYAFFPENTSKLDETIEKLRSVIRSQYALSYKPPNRHSKNSWRSIEVKCKRKGVKLRYRKGYFSD
jgi:Ca-activated chloride channel family protein